MLALCCLNKCSIFVNLGFERSQVQALSLKKARIVNLSSREADVWGTDASLSVKEIFMVNKSSCHTFPPPLRPATQDLCVLYIDLIITLAPEEKKRNRAGAG